MALLDSDADVALLRRAVPDTHVRGITRFTDRLAELGGRPDLLPGVLADAVMALPSEVAIVWLADDDGRLTPRAVRNRLPSREEALLASLVDDVEPVVVRRVAGGRRRDDLTIVSANGVIGEVYRSRRATRVPADADLSPSLEAVLRDVKAAEAVVVPIGPRDRAVGVLLAARGRRAHQFSAMDQDTLALLGQRSGTALEAERLAGAVRQATTLVDDVLDAVVAVDPAGRISTWNRAAERMYRVPAPEAIGRPVEDVLITTTVVGGEPDEGRRLLRTPVRGEWRGRLRQGAKSGVVIDVEATIVARTDVTGGYAGFVCVNRDVGDMLAAEASASEQTRFTQGLMDALDSRAAVLDPDGAVISANAQWLGALAERSACLCGPVPVGQAWVTALEASGVAETEEFAATVRRLLAGEVGTAHLECRCEAGGGDRVSAVEVVRLEGGDGGAVVVQSDVSWRRRLQDELSHRATHDELTGLPNRAALMSGLAASLRRLDGDSVLAVMFCDLDGFKDINDGLGHAVGDQVLVAVARRLRQRCRSADVVARFGGDEFVVVLTVPDVAHAAALADRIVEVLAEPIVVRDVEVAPGVSIGISVVEHLPEGDDPVGTLLRDADTAMYHAKERGRGRHEFFDVSLRENIAERLELAAALHRAVADDEFEIVYQARRYCGDRQVAGVEALLQWNHPTLGRVGPDVFIPIAERTGRIVEVGRWALRRAMTEIAALDDPRLTVAVNVSPKQLATARLAHTVAQALDDSGLAPSRLVLEITESALMDDPAAAHDVLTDLRRLGVSIALDDFGTGWSSLSYLRTLPVDILKVDKSFVADLPQDPDAAAVVSAVLNLGHGMGMVVVAEGVETPEQLQVLRDMACDEYQGFIDGRPGPLREVLSTRP